MTLKRIKMAALSLLNPWRVARELRDENARLLALISDPLLTGITVGNGGLGISLEGAGPELTRAIRL